MRERFPRGVYARGTEPDPRFSLANERTFLAWVRTALALLAVGVALEAVQVPVSPTLRFASAAIFVLLGLLAAVQGWCGWRRTETALREGSPLPPASSALVIVIGVVLAVALLAVGHAWG
ncbi:YidH family protein [Pseudoclavibacter sp. RFBB5]|uniref:YidH family protein n=1 Tax=Pseudoclavibacter sp. RFBB5 TaxID=2080574 RepID=UPI000CE92F34|nr:DUF202 domain-containing protein [Pseudoclavibacter sp. RFBB5]PPG33490.1 hypothetical protein C5B97_02490 [Pseudoclavibacter sp. RFBB5]